MASAAISIPSTDVFGSKGIQCIGMIDDAFDPLQVLAVQSEIGAFWATLEQDEDLLKRVLAAGIDIAKVADITDAALQNLWSRRKEIDGLEKPIQALLQRRFSIIEDAEEILANIQALNFTVQSTGTSGTLTDEALCKIILLDYYLGSEDQDAVDASVNKAIEIYGRSEGRDEKPVFVLMSSAQLSETQIEQFRERSSLIGGMFHHIPKSDLKNREMLERKLLAIALSMPIAPAIVSLIEALERSLASAKKTFGQRMRDLSLEDYAYIDRLSLREDGQPFGDYMLWLFSGELQRLVFENEDVRGHRDSVDRTRFPDLPVKQITPSKQLANMYRTALFQELDNQMPVHPLGDKDHEHPLLSLGDIFVNDKRKLLMVINPECDLAYSPLSNGRPFSETKSIVLIPGALQDLAKAPSKDDDEKLRTELFVHEDVEYRIFWDTKRVLMQPYGEIKTWLEKEGYRRQYRLRLLYALQVQQKFTSDFGRVGPPVAPPLFTPVQIEVLCFDEEGKYMTILAPMDKCAAVVNSKSGVGCVFELSFLERLLAIFETAMKQVDARIYKLNERIDSLTAKAATPAEGPIQADAATKKAADAVLGTVEKMRTNIERKGILLEQLKKFAGDPVAQMKFISTAHPMPPLGDVTTIDVPSELFAICYERELKGNFQQQCLFVIRVQRSS